MSTIQAIKQLEERNVPSEIVLMVWSDRMDLVALANIKGEVALHRLTWTKAWSLSPPKDGLAVKSIAWRPDGKIIAIAYSSGEIILVKVENKNLLHSIEIEGDITCLNWMQDRQFVKPKNVSVNEETEQNTYMKYIDLSPNFLPEPIPHQFDTSSEDTPKNNLLQEQNDLNLLLIGTNKGTVHIHIFGCFPAASLDLNTVLNTQCTIESVHLSETLTHMFVTVRDSNTVKLVVFDSQIFKSHTNELFAVALKHIKVTSLVHYLLGVISMITESWESILLEMDNKLSKYAGQVPEGGVTADFLDLLMFGVCSDEMKAFLIHDLNKKGLEKFGQTIEMSYSNIQKLVLKYVMKFGQNITYHLAELRGMSRLEHRYKLLGLQEDAITDAILSNGAFLIKAGEMQQIINHSIVNYKAFFRWLYTAIVHVLEEQVPSEIPKMTQQDVAYITEFLQNFDRIGRSSKQNGFIMERLGQYLSDSALTIKPDMSGNDWSHFLTANQCVSQNSNILRHFENMSLIQQYRHLSSTVERIFDKPKSTIGGQFHPCRVLDCVQNPTQELKVTQINTSNDNVVFCFVQPPQSLHLLHLHVDGVVKTARIYFTQDDSDEVYRIADAKLYSSTVLSVLLQENNVAKGTVLWQVPLGVALEQFGDPVGGVVFGEVVGVNGACLVPRLVKNVEGMVGAEFAVSGCRKVGIVLAENRRKVRLYEMEGEEEEDEDAEMTNSTVKDGDMSVQEMNV